MSPSECEVTFSGGGVVSLGFVVAVVWVSEAAAVVSAAVSEVVVEGSRVVVVEGGCVVDVAWVVATRVSVSATRSASTAEATRADTCEFCATVVGAVATSDGDEDGENAAKPITATRAMMRRLAYASGIRGLTCLRESACGYCPAGASRMHTREEPMKHSAPLHLLS